MTVKSTQAKVVIVGAGLSGLVTAYKLAKQGIDFQLLEARERFGGRILSCQSSRSSACFDLGPSWFWPGQSHIENLIQELGLSKLVYRQYATGDAVYQTQGGALQRGVSGISMAGSYRLQGGLTSLIDALVDRIVKRGFGGRLHLSSTVFKVEKVSNKVCLSYRYSDSKTELQLLSQQVVMALPARIVLDNIEIYPGLNADRHDELEAVATWMAGQSKVVVEYARPFWRDAGFSGDVISQLGPMSEIHDASSDSVGTESQAFALFGFLGVAAAERNQHAQQLPNLIIAQLVTLFGDQAKTPINITIQDWANEPLTASKYDQNIPNHHPFNSWSSTIEPGWGGGLLWSGAEAASDHTNGYLEGAILASEQTFEQLH